MILENDRYLIYTLLGRSVEIRLSMRHGGHRLMGVVEKVYRDIFNNQVEVTVSGEKHSFQEPTAIVHDNNNEIHFLYGDLGADIEPSGFELPEYNAYDESLHEHLRRTEKRPVSRTVFKVGDVERTPRNRWRSRVAV
jgi:hypothetical protein